MPADSVGPIVEKWVESCTRHKKIARNTIAMGIVVLDHLRKKCPLKKADVVSAGGEIAGSRTPLRDTLESYGIPRTFLKEATTRQVHQDGQHLLEALDYGEKLAKLTTKDRDAQLRSAIGKLCDHARQWLNRQNLKIACDSHKSPASWVTAILDQAKGRSGGIVEQHLVGAKLEKRFASITIPNHPSHAGDAQTGRQGDFVVGKTAFHVTATPSRDVIGKCKANLASGLHPILLVPLDQVARAKHYAELEGIDQRMSIIAIEDFVALNIIEMSMAQQAEFVATLRGIIDAYNRRIGEAETDMSLKIDLQ